MNNLLICIVGSIRPDWASALESFKPLINSFKKVDIQCVTNRTMEIYPPWCFENEHVYKFGATFSPDIREKCMDINDKINSCDKRRKSLSFLERPIGISIDENYIESTIRSILPVNNINIKIDDKLYDNNMIAQVEKLSQIEVSDDYSWVLRIRPDYKNTTTNFNLSQYNINTLYTRIFNMNRQELFNKDLPINRICDGIAFASPEIMKVYFQVKNHINNEKKIPLRRIHYFFADYLYSKKIQIERIKNINIVRTKFNIDQYYIDNILPTFIPEITII